jgi:hypothetical protein
VLARRSFIFETRSCNHSRIGDNYGDSSGKLWSIYLAEAEKEDKELTEAWKGEADSILVFVSKCSCIHSMSPSNPKANLKDRSVFHHCRGLHHRKLQEVIS